MTKAATVAVSVERAALLESPARGVWTPLCHRSSAQAASGCENPLELIDSLGLRVSQRDDATEEIVAISRDLPGRQRRGVGCIERVCGPAVLC